MVRVTAWKYLVCLCCRLVMFTVNLILIGCPSKISNPISTPDTKLYLLTVLKTYILLRRNSLKNPVQVTHLQWVTARHWWTGCDCYGLCMLGTVTGNHFLHVLFYTVPGIRNEVIPSWDHHALWVTNGIFNRFPHRILTANRDYLFI